MPTTPDRPADQLHAAAAKLRAVSSAATDGPWTIANIPPYTDPVLMSRYEETPADGEVLIVGNVGVGEEDQAQIALMHPGVGLAMADWLDVAAEYYTPGPAHPTHVVHALAVARQLLGTSTGEAASLGPADGQQKMRLLARLHASLTPIPAETDEEREQREDREEAARLHAAGVHQYCDVTCETAMPTKAMRNFVIAKGYPGTAGALDELLRRATAAAPPAPADRAATRDRIRRAICEASGFTWLPDELMEPDEYGEHADAVLAVLAGEAAAGAHHPEQAQTLGTKCACGHARRWHFPDCRDPKGQACDCLSFTTPAVPAAPEETR
ncbi:hypothetical protein AB0L02_27500 [Streptomyces anulatus]|uniref:hypothetical protein n=1 Tax=Streptomyces anulatus TaxID=1892 RepID=UPI003447EB86